MTKEAVISDRLTYAAFPASLKSAMRDAGRDYGWTREDWRLHTQCCAEAISRGIFADDLADRYRHPHPDCLKYRLKPPEMALEGTNAL